MEVRKGKSNKQGFTIFGLNLTQLKWTRSRSLFVGFKRLY